MPIVLDDLKLSYTPVPKTACTSLKMVFFDIENGREFVPFRHNGREFHSEALEMAAGRYGITIQFCPRRKPWFKAKVERFFGTLNSGLLVDLKGKAFSSIARKRTASPPFAGR